MYSGHHSIGNNRYGNNWMLACSFVVFLKAENEMFANQKRLFVFNTLGVYFEEVVSCDKNYCRRS